MLLTTHTRLTVVLYLVVLSHSGILSKPMEGVGDDNVVNMEVGQDTLTEADNQWPEQNTENVQAEVIDNAWPNQETDNPVDGPIPAEEDNPGEPAANEEVVHIPREEEEEQQRIPVQVEIDWGHGGGAGQWEGDDPQQQTQEQQQEQPVQEEPEVQVDYQPQEHQEVVHVADSHEGVGVINPEEVMHGDDGHIHDQQPSGADRNSQEVAAEARRQAELRQEVEQEELRFINPQVIANVHDTKARTAADFMKDRQFGPNDVEEIIHGGHHVHGAESDGGRGQVQGGDVELLAHGVEGVHEDHGKDQKVHLTVDPEELMHTGDHDHNPHGKKDTQPSPGVDSPVNTMPKGHEGQADSVEVVVDKDSIGPTFEKSVHGEDHVHEPVPAGYKSKNKVRYQDIIDLGLSQEALKGIDLSKLLEQEQREFDDWQKEAKDSAAADEDGSEDDGDNSAYWQKQVTDLRRRYLEKLYAKVRDISQPDLEHAEWEDEDEGSRHAHDGESRVEHEMEMWGSTQAKGGRKPYKLMNWRGGAREGDTGGEGEGAAREGVEGQERGAKGSDEESDL